MKIDQHDLRRICSVSVEDCPERLVGPGGCLPAIEESIRMGVLPTGDRPAKRREWRQRQITKPRTLTKELRQRRPASWAFAYFTRREAGNARMAASGASKRRRLDSRYTRHSTAFREEFGDNVLTLTSAICFTWLGTPRGWLLQVNLPFLLCADCLAAFSLPAASFSSLWGAQADGRLRIARSAACCPVMSAMRMASLDQYSHAINAATVVPSLRSAAARSEAYARRRIAIQLP